jgi:hypothetical protein
MAYTKHDALKGKLLIGLVTTSFCAAAAPPASNQGAPSNQPKPSTYRWVDEKGKVHYGDTLPAKQTGLGHAELDKQGRLLQDVKRNRLSVQEQQLQDEEQERQERALRQSTQQQRRDKALISTYANVKEIEQARVRAQELESNKLKSLQTRREEAVNRLKGLAASKNNPNMTKHLEAASLEVETLNKAIAKQDQDMADLNKRFDSDIARYKQLTEDLRR